MSDIVFEALKLIIMVAVLVVCRYIVPYFKMRIDADKLEVISGWTRTAVLQAQQVMIKDTGADKKAIVTEFLKEILADKNISISDQQLDALIEAAVKQMKTEETRNA